MNLRHLAPILLVAAAAPKLPAEPTAQKKELLFADGFERSELSKEKGSKKAWAIVVPTFSVENGTLKGTQMRYDTPAADGKPAVKVHQAVTGNDIPNEKWTA